MATQNGDGRSAGTNASGARPAGAFLGGRGDAGLTDAEAASRLEAQGPNELTARPPRSPLSIFVAQFASFLVFVLFAAAAVSALLGEWIDAAVIVAILVLNAALGTAQEYRAERAIEALKRLTAPTAQVIREGRLRVVPARELVSGDIMVLEPGSIVPADGRLLWVAGLSVNEAVLTGESLPAEKTAATQPPESGQAARASKVFSGTTVLAGRATALVLATGMETEFGKIARTVDEVKTEETPLRASVEAIGRQLTLGVIAACAIVFCLGVIDLGPAVFGDLVAAAASLNPSLVPPLAGDMLVQVFLASVSLAVAAIPEGLPAVITIALALGVQQMSRRNAIVRRLSSVETLGSADVICTDKTGTLTKNEMVARTLYVSGEWVTVSGSEHSCHGKLTAHHHAVAASGWTELSRLMRVGVLCNNAHVSRAPDGSLAVAGDPTESALLILADKACVDRAAVHAEARFLREVPFDSGRKMMSVAYDVGREGPTSFVKGAPEAVLAACTHYLEKGTSHPLNPPKRAAFLAANREMASHALRVLGFAERALESVEPHAASMERELTFIGLIGLIDAPREGVKEAIELCREAGIEVVMVTGDNEETAHAVGKELGLLRHHSDRIVTGAELDIMDDAELSAHIERIRIYARVSPEHKLRIVQAWKARGKTVAMTGDGVNDAPALKRADIGIAMGVTGTDVAKEVSDLVLADDNFVSIVDAVREGRGVYDNIRKCLVYLVSCNIAEVLIVFLAAVFGRAIPLGAVQLLWINLVTDGLPALALASDPVDPSVMARTPRPRGQSVWSGARAFLIGLPLIATSLALLLLLRGGMVGKTLAFTFLIVFETGVSLGCMDLANPVLPRLAKNRWLLLSAAAALALQFALIATPATQTLFEVVPLGAADLALVLALGTSGFAYMEAYKWWKGRRG